MGRRVVVTGYGIINAIGNNADEVWASILAGRSGIAPISRFDTDGFETTFAGEVKEFDGGAVVGRKEARRMDRYTQYAIATALQAREHAGLNPERITLDPTTVSVLIASAMGGMETMEQGMEAVITGGPRRVGPFTIPAMLANMASGNVAITVGATGPNYAPVSACAASAHAIGEAARIIQRGHADVAYAGGAEAPITRLSLAGYNSMGALSRRNDDPATASRPFDAGRDGFVLAEGSATLVLEEREHALARGATIHAELLGYGATDDANHIVQPAPGGEGAARAMSLALAEAELDPAQIDYINAHGTSTPLNEKLETEAIKRAFGDAARSVAISSTKSMTGHTLGAAGAIEAAITFLAMRHQVLPPTINQFESDPDCDLDYVPNQARPGAIRYAMSNSMGFGGHNVSLVFGAHEE
ncbi:MAG: beta-ketoacyl-ACP synthase II [Thermomicrobiales bacterium]|nr:beta-ketoacyl-ACP synthase II [Thermomicrobiales bacterium]